jgi:hypothetical protein
MERHFSGRADVATRPAGQLSGHDHGGRSAERAARDLLVVGSGAAGSPRP